MDVRYFLTARYAERSPDGTVNLFGAATSFIPVPAFPHLIQNLYVAASVALDRAEARTPHHLSVTFTAPDGELVFKSEDLATEAIEIPESREFMQVNFVLDLRNLLFPSGGLYTLRLFFDGEMVKDSPVFLESLAALNARIERQEVVVPL
jgi:hypothetical protein